MTELAGIVSAIPELAGRKRMKRVTKVVRDWASRLTSFDPSDDPVGDAAATAAPFVVAGVATILLFDGLTWWQWILAFVVTYLATFALVILVIGVVVGMLVWLENHQDLGRVLFGVGSGLFVTSKVIELVLTA